MNIPASLRKGEGAARAARSQSTAEDQREIAEEHLTSDGFRAMDRMTEALIARSTNGLSPQALWLAYADWLIHLATAPGKQLDLIHKAGRKTARLMSDTVQSSLDPAAPRVIEPLPGDHRFDAEDWRRQPFRFWSQAFLLGQQWWHNATREVPGLSRHHEDVVWFWTRQALDTFSPTNSALANPEVIERTIATGGVNLLQGVQNLAEDAARLASGQVPVGAERYGVGETVAVTPGKVVYRNTLIELIQYAPTTATVAAEPILLVSAWIMKYYILDLSPQNSLVRYLVDAGHTVFCISWRNVTAEDRQVSLDDYRRLGVLAALDAIAGFLPGRRVHAAGYCLGGTLLALTAAALARDGDQRLASLTLLAAQVDFMEAGEIQLFIDESQLTYIKALMWDKGVLDGSRMAGAFQMLRSNDLIWSHMVHGYLMGERPEMTDLMAWNADATRMPYRMHSEYLTNFFLNNDLASGRTMVDGKTVSLQSIRTPIFAVGTERDHVAPWRSVYKIHALTDTEITFLLTVGGHNAGIVSEPGHHHRSYRMGVKDADQGQLSPDEWLACTSQRQGSWWTPWEDWLVRQGSGGQVAPPPAVWSPSGIGRMTDAPGTYVRRA